MKVKTKETYRFDPFFGFVAESERRAEGFEADKHRGLSVGTHIDKRSAGNDAMLGDTAYEKTVQTKPTKEIKGESHKEINYYVDRFQLLFRNIKFFDRHGNVSKYTSHKVKTGKYHRVPEFGLDTEETGGITTGPLGTKLNIHTGDTHTEDNLPLKVRQIIKDSSEKKEKKEETKKWYSNFFELFK